VAASRRSHCAFRHLANPLYCTAMLNNPAPPTPTPTPQPIHPDPSAARTRRHPHRRRVGRALKLEPPQQHAQPHDRLEQRELVADALALAAAKGEVLEVLSDLVGHRGIYREPAVCVCGGDWCGVGGGRGVGWFVGFGWLLGLWGVGCRCCWGCGGLIAGRGV